MTGKINPKLLGYLVFGTIGIYASYISAGLLNQRIIKKPYLSDQAHALPQHFDSTLFFIFVTTAVPWLLGSIILKLTVKRSEQTTIPVKNSMICAMVILISAFSYINSIFYASFPIAALFKSCSLLSVVLVGVCCSRVHEKGLKLGNNKIVVALMITVGLMVFKFTDPETKQGEEKKTETIGIAFLIVSLIADGFLPDFQAEIKSKYKPKPIEMMTQNNKWVCLFSLVLLIVTNNLGRMVEFCANHRDFLFHIVVMGLLATVGQLFVYWLIKEFKQHIVPFIITTRKITTSGLSLVVYNHEKSWGQAVAIGMIFAIVVYEFGNEIRVKEAGYKQVNGIEMNDIVREQQVKVISIGPVSPCETVKL